MPTPENPRFASLGEWLSWQETLHPEAIDLGLERVSAVARKLGCIAPAPVVITVAGTNGKGSSVALLESILRRAGYRTGCYTSPHLFRYNERLRIDGQDIDDTALCKAFARIDAARGEQTLSYFEFGTLAALDIMHRAQLDVAVLEVGLGGRLDAVNVADADAALVTSIGIDHTEWLGDDRESIGAEKAGVFRSGCPAVCADSQPPESLRRVAAERGASWFQLGREFRIREQGRSWHWESSGMQFTGLQLPALAGSHQVANAAGVLMVLVALAERLPVSVDAVQAGLRWVRLPGRIQRLGGRVEQVLDVSHNAHAAAALTDALRRFPVAGATWAVIGMMGDKDIREFIEALGDCVRFWCPVALDVQRAASCDQLAAAIAATAPVTEPQPCAGMREIVDSLKARVQVGDRILVCGSFYTVSEWVALAPDFD